MEMNKKIFDYAFCGIPYNKDRSVITTLENVLIGLGVLINYSFDTEFSHYFIAPGRKVFLMEMVPNNRATRTIVSPFEYLCILLNQEVNINWFEQLKEGDTVKIGRCHASEYYPLHFDTSAVRRFFGEEVTISEIIKGRLPVTPKGYFNGDPRAYYIEEIGQFLPSSVFIPQFAPTTPIQKINLISCFIDIDNGLK